MNNDEKQVVILENRRLEIVEIVNREGEISFAALKKRFPEVSEVTLRKDLKYLDATMQLVRIHGGVKSVPTAIGAVDNFYTRSTKKVEEKRLIAEKAVKLLRPNQSIFISAGSTCAELCKILQDIPLQVFTNGLVTAVELAKVSSVETTILGGKVAANDVRSSGPRFFDELNELHFDLAFIGIDGYSTEFGFVCCSAHSASMFQALAKRSDKLVVLMDHSKVDAARAARNVPANRVDVVVSDGLLDAAALKSLTQAGVSVL